jgi:Ca-activated chloride channel family protein
MPEQNHRPALEVTADRSLVRHAGGSTRYLRLQVLAPLAQSDKARSPAEVAFALDRSGSMNGEKIELAKQAVNDALAFLSPSDHFSVVTFSDEATPLIARTEATPPARSAAQSALAMTHAGGGTALFAGWLTACGNLDTQDGESLARCLLLTDGLANVGPSDPDVLIHHARELLARGVRTSTFGLGRAFNEELLDALATAGGGNFYFIENATQIPDYFASELGEALETTARDVRINLRVPGLHCEPLTTLDHDREGDVVSIRLGDMTSGQIINLVVALRFPEGAVGSAREVGVELHARPADGLPTGRPVAEATLRFTYADHAQNDRQHRDIAVDQVVAQAYASKARMNAVALNRSGDYTAAGQVLQQTARRIAEYAGEDQLMRQLVNALEQEATEFRHALNEGRRKAAYSESTSMLKSRSRFAKAIRG